MNETAPNNHLKSLTTRQIVIRIVAIISTVEFLVMLLLGALRMELGIYSMATIDLITLALFSTPLIYILVIKPFVVARDEAIKHIGHLANTDALTELPNRRFLLMHLEACLAGAIRHNIRGAILLIDLNNFKTINDEHGHDAGDKVLIEVAKRLQSLMRTEDVTGRMGGDEFVILLQHLNNDAKIAHDTTLGVAKKVVKEIIKPIQLNGTTLNVGASVGIRLLGFNECNASTAIKEADAAMYRAKQAGNGCIEFFEN